MLTYSLPLPGKNLSQSLYQCIREDILSGRLSAGEKLPSKRALADHLQVSKTTVENAYYQLTAEGYVRAETKRGYFVEQVERRLPRSAPACRSGPHRSQPGFRRAGAVPLLRVGQAGPPGAV